MGSPLKPPPNPSTGALPAEAAARFQNSKIVSCLHGITSIPLRFHFDSIVNSHQGSFKSFSVPSSSQFEVTLIWLRCVGVRVGSVRLYFLHMCSDFRTCLVFFGGRSTEAMHEACVRDNTENNGVIKAFRMAGWLAFRPTSKGLIPARGPGYEEMPLGSSRIRQAVTDQRSFIQWEN